MRALLAFAIMVIATLPSAAYAINCARASTHIDHLICADPKLMRADAAMGRAYAAILKAAPDREIHAMLVSSQQRWIAARDRSFGSTGQAGNTSPEAAQYSFVLDATEDRTTSLRQMSHDTPKQFYLIQAALQQRRFAAQSTGGPFSGYDTSCDFFPSDGAGGDRAYACFATHYFQNDNRICSQELYWATYRIYTARSVAVIVEGKPKLVATCKEDDCEDDEAGTDSGWNSHTDASNAVAFPQSLPKLDAEVMDSMVDDEPAWLKACLTDRRFPSAQSRK